MMGEIAVGRAFAEFKIGECLDFFGDGFVFFKAIVADVVPDARGGLIHQVTGADRYY